MQAALKASEDAKDIALALSDHDKAAALELSESNARTALRASENDKRIALALSDHNKASALYLSESLAQAAFKASEEEKCVARALSDHDKAVALFRSESQALMVLTASENEKCIALALSNRDKAAALYLSKSQAQAAFNATERAKCIALALSVHSTKTAVKQATLKYNEMLLRAKEEHACFISQKIMTQLTAALSGIESLTRELEIDFNYVPRQRKIWISQSDLLTLKWPATSRLIIWKTLYFSAFRTTLRRTKKSM
jgi:hypothetical protein